MLVINYLFNFHITTNMEIIEKYEYKPLFPILINIILVCSGRIDYYVFNLDNIIYKRTKYISIIYDFVIKLQLSISKNKNNYIKIFIIYGLTYY